jgi:hypothetical protein
VVSIPLVGGDFRRIVSKAPAILMKNRYAEKNPVLNEDPVAVISRPGMFKFAEIGTGPIRKVYSCPGVFSGDLFVVSGTDLYRVSSTNLTATLIGTISTATVGDVSMCATAPIGTVPGYLYLAEGGVLWVYTDNGHAHNTFTASGTISNGDVAVVNTTYYKFVTGAPGAGNGTVGTPWQISIGTTTAATLTRFYDAINATGTAGTDYTTGLTAHATVHATACDATDVFVEAIDNGIAGNAFPTTETGANTAWALGATLTGGGSAQLRQVQVPDSAGAISVDVINSFVIVVPVQGDTIKGRFYFIQPGENTIDELDFATAERNPDGVHQVKVYGDMFWLLGENTTEPWITTGDATAPVSRFKGILFDRGSWEGTAVQVKDSLIVVDEDGAVFQIAGQQKRISRPDIEEQIRRAKQIQKGS